MQGREVETDESRKRSRPAAAVVIGVLGCFLVPNTYWGLGGSRGLEWILGSDVTLSLALVWVQEVAIVVGITVVSGRAGIWRLPAPGWFYQAGIWSMALVFGAVGVYNLIGDNTVQARFLFAPVALVMGALCVVVAVGSRWPAE
ncbi:MAG: hypothetical protein H0T17_02315 [Propionibacteriales bacterium]|nr:hypothetical protein [Propionibacteriales bacterium]